MFSEASRRMTRNENPLCSMMIHNCMALTEYYISMCCRSSLKAIAWEELSVVIEMSHRWVEKWGIYAASNNLLCASTARAIYAINYSPLFRWAHENYWKHQHCVQDCSFASTTGTLGAYKKQQVDVSASPFSERRKREAQKLLIGSQVPLLHLLHSIR